MSSSSSWAQEFTVATLSRWPPVRVLLGINVIYIYIYIHTYIIYTRKWRVAQLGLNAHVLLVYKAPSAHLTLRGRSRATSPTPLEQSRNYPPNMRNKQEIKLPFEYESCSLLPLLISSRFACGAWILYLRKYKQNKQMHIYIYIYIYTYT